MMLRVMQVTSRPYCSSSLVYDLLNIGRLPYVQIGTWQGCRHITEEDEDRFFTETRKCIREVLDKQLKPYQSWGDPQIPRQVGLIIEHYMRAYQDDCPDKCDPDLQFPN